MGPSAHNRGPLPPLPTPVNSTSLTQVNSASLIHKLNTALTDVIYVEIGIPLIKYFEPFSKL